MSYVDTTKKYDNRLEAVIVCANYGDFLQETLPYNLAHLDRVVVVTPHADEHTRSVCAKWSVECVVSDAFTEKGDTLNKGAAINVGIARLRQRGWIIQMDADIVLPVTFRNMIDKSGLQPDCIYGCERANVRGWATWQRLRKDLHETPQFGYNYLITSPDHLPIGANVVHKQFGYTPIGFFQLWNSSYMHQYNLRYPDTEGSAENMDVQFALHWPRHKRILLPTVRAFHLESADASMGINWNGRKSAPFQPGTVAESAALPPGVEPESTPLPMGYGYCGKTYAAYSDTGMSIQYAMGIIGFAMTPPVGSKLSAYVVGDKLKITSLDNQHAWMEGIIISYACGNTYINLTRLSGHGWYSSWVINRV